MPIENLIVARASEGSVAVVTVNRPKALNALSSQTVAELLAVAGELEADRSVRAVILTGAGEKAFVAGADIAEMSQMSVREAKAFAELGWKLGSTIELSSKPWIAAVNGFALGGGCELALACDFIYAAKTARFGQPEVNLGVIPGFGGTQRLLRRVGIAKARELIYTGDMINADEALRIGLADAVVDQSELLPRANQTAEKIADKGPLAIAEAKRVMQLGQSLPLGDACTIEAMGFAALFDTADQKEGMKAFVEKRKARFEGK
ncbi:MAG: enoyl-CoA hydratase-related protein [Pseudomonadota bacterium]